jgi:hypothetical protein
MEIRSGNVLGWTRVQESQHPCTNLPALTFTLDVVASGRLHGEEAPQKKGRHPLAETV